MQATAPHPPHPVPHLLPALSSVLLPTQCPGDPPLVLKGRQGGMGVGARDVAFRMLWVTLPAGRAEDAAGSRGTCLGNGAPRRSPGEPPPRT